MQALILFVSLAVVWLLWSGYLEVALLSYGALSCAFVVLSSLRANTLDRESLPVQMTVRCWFYLPWLLVEIVKSNFDVARIILDPKLPMHPHIIRVPSSQRTDVGTVVFANSITLTPGTITLDVRDDEILVHALADPFAKELLDGEMDRRVSEMEGEG